jgi:serine/threonine-protein kinase
MPQAPQPPSSADEPAPSVLDLVARRIGEAPRVTLRDEESGNTASPVIDASSKEKAAVPRGRSNYQFLGEIARGGMGVILKGHDTDLGRDVAVKVLDKRLSDRPEVVQRFVEEAQIGGQLQHPGIVPVYELGTMLDERPFFTMKLVKGRTLAVLLAERENLATNRQRLIAIFESVCQTLGYAHSRGVIHRDLKPANIMVGAFGEVQVVDWGLAKVLARGGTADEKRARVAHTQLTVLETVRSSQGSGSGSDSMVGSVMGTPAYMPPEQAAGHVDRLDERSDVFALGAILCEILTGLPPYVGERDQIIAAAAQAETEGAFERLAKCGADPELVKLTKHCLMPAAAARPANGGVLAERVHQYVVSVEERALAARAESAAALVRVEDERKARRLTAALGAALVVILLVGGGSFAYVQRERATHEHDLAQAAKEKSERDAKLSAEVGNALAEAALHKGGGRWNEAILATQRARALAEGGGAGTELSGRVDAVLADLQAGRERAEKEALREADNKKLLAELLEAREPVWNPGQGASGGTSEAYVGAFQRHGIEIDAGTPEEVAAALKQRGFGSEIALFLDSLTAIRRRARDESGTTRALDLAHAVDPEPLRADLREALAAGALDVLRGIVQSGFEDQPPITVELLGSALEELKQRDLARAVYRRGIDRFPADFSLHYRLGRLLTPPELDSGPRDEMQEAVENYRSALALRPDSVVSRYYLGRLYWKLGEYDRSVEQYTILLKQRPDDGTFLFHLGAGLYSLGRTEPALEILRPLVERREPSWLRGWSALMTGHCLMLRGELKQATSYFEIAVDADPSQAQFRTGLFEAVLSGDSVEDRQHLVEQYLGKSSADPNLLNNLAWVLTSTANVKMRDYDAAARLARRSTELGNGFEAWNTLGVALYFTGDMKGAIDALQHSVRLQGAGQVVDWLFLAMANQKLGNTGEAKLWYERATEWIGTQSGLDPEVARFLADAKEIFGH